MKITEFKEIQVKKCGLVIDTVYDELACSPDGLVQFID